MYPIQYKRDGEIFQVDGLQLKSKGGKPKGKIRNWFKWPLFDILWPGNFFGPDPGQWFRILNQKSLKITVPSNSGYDDATERSNLEAMKKQSFSTYTLAPSLAAMDEGMFLTHPFDLRWPLSPWWHLHWPWNDKKLQKILQCHHVHHHIMAVSTSLLNRHLHLDHDLHQASLIRCQNLLVWRDRRILQIQIQFIKMNLSDSKDKMINSDRLWKKKNMKWRQGIYQGSTERNWIHGKKLNRRGVYSHTTPSRWYLKRI